MSRTKGKGAISAKSLLASFHLDRLGHNPLEEVIKAIKELDELKSESLRAFKELRGYSSSADAGTQYLATAVKCVTDKAAINLKLARFKHPELSAIAIQDVSDRGDDKAPMTTADAIRVIAADPFAPASIKDVNTDDVIKAMNTHFDAPALPIGKSDAKPD